MKRELQKYIKSFSKGQITVPKEFREVLGLSDEFWLKLYIKDEKIIAEPVERNSGKQTSYLDTLKEVDTSWFDEKTEKELKDSRKALKMREKKYYD
ncbi:MAG: hypothetical protein ACD_24C00459G0009 [uncultured bacterium]|uniref:SpoVT-AbrB domain-containing protein n=1 Tax=candidate division WWE3 bacterium RBG_16_37_10 TaxID=1802610 RepID=A0A1F4V2H0_UNCKA|nr:MAG: hypothetical protein ACD_24C00459G0009 [uncultured bacterium]OGC51415.1 MAG: hypothetical protein A2W32_01145 [candidate division WWE3 bacterium RBG_16_37_10]